MIPFEESAGLFEGATDCLDFARAISSSTSYMYFTMLFFWASFIFIRTEETMSFQKRKKKERPHPLF